MSGIPRFNFPAFDTAAKWLRSQLWTVISPAELDEPLMRKAAMDSPDGKPSPSQHSWGKFLARDVEIVADQCQGIIFLPGWQKSRGAKLEACVGLACGHDFYLYLPDASVARMMPAASIYIRSFVP